MREEYDFSNTKENPYIKEQKALEDMEQYIAELQNEGQEPTIIEMLIVAKEALKLQVTGIPKIQNCLPFSNWNDGWCPNCHSYVKQTDEKSCHCEYCGKKLVWPESLDDFDGIKEKYGVE